MGNLLARCADFSGFEMRMCFIYISEFIYVRGISRETDQSITALKKNVSNIFPVPISISSLKKSKIFQNYLEVIFKAHSFLKNIDIDMRQLVLLFSSNSSLKKRIYNNFFV